MTKFDRQAIKGMTMACWWPSKITGLKTPDWENIYGELDCLIEGEEFYSEVRGSNLDRLHRFHSLRELVKIEALRPIA